MGSSVTEMKDMFHKASSFNQSLCAWEDRFPYIEANDIFVGSGCVFQETPRANERGPFCASKCLSSQPSMNPTSSGAPSLQPSISPSVSSAPSRQPSAHPSVSTAPSNQPSMGPSLSPC